LNPSRGAFFQGTTRASGSYWNAAYSEENKMAQNEHNTSRTQDPLPTEKRRNVWPWAVTGILVLVIAIVAVTNQPGVPTGTTSPAMEGTAPSALPETAPSTTPAPVQ
jgi:hypothetical protein